MIAFLKLFEWSSYDSLVAKYQFELQDDPMLQRILQTSDEPEEAVTELVMQRFPPEDHPTLYSGDGVRDVVKELLPA